MSSGVRPAVSLPRTAPPAVTRALWLCSDVSASIEPPEVGRELLVIARPDRAGRAQREGPDDVHATRQP